MLTAHTAARRWLCSQLFTRLLSAVSMSLSCQRASLCVSLFSISRARARRWPLSAQRTRLGLQGCNAQRARVRLLAVAAIITALQSRPSCPASEGERWTRRRSASWSTYVVCARRWRRCRTCGETKESGAAFRVFGGARRPHASKLTLRRDTRGRRPHAGRQFIEGEQQKARFQSAVHNFTDICFEKCICMAWPARAGRRACTRAGH